ncbi:MAG: hypothetical protein JXA20_09965 [Spirochaetes bacterium]|nr:hypothetical protein [Spirochaetota bacterium]
MAVIKLNEMITDVRNKKGTNVYSRWKGLNYVRCHNGQVKDANTESQRAVRAAFAALTRSWKGLAAVMKESWEHAVRGMNMTGYNSFIASNFGRMKGFEAITLSRGTGEAAVRGFSAAAGAQAGEIACTFEALPEGRELTVFAQRKGNGGELTFHRGNGSGCFTVQGLEQGAEYHLYAVVSAGDIDTSKTVSESVSASAKAA